MLHFSAHVTYIHIPAAVYAEEISYTPRDSFVSIVIWHRRFHLILTGRIHYPPHKVKTLRLSITGENVVDSGVTLCPFLKRILMNVQNTIPLTCLRYSWTIEHDTMFCMKAI